MTHVAVGVQFNKPEVNSWKGRGFVDPILDYFCVGYRDQSLSDDEKDSMRLHFLRTQDPGPGERPRHEVKPGNFTRS